MAIKVPTAPILGNQRIFSLSLAKEAGKSLTIYFTGLTTDGVDMSASYAYTFADSNFVTFRSIWTSTTGSSAIPTGLIEIRFKSTEAMLYTRNIHPITAAVSFTADSTKACRIPGVDAGLFSELP
jgi:hypothetical protein